MIRPAERVLHAYTDEALEAQSSFKGEAAAALLRVPAEYRQPVEAEATRRSSYTENRNGYHVDRFVRDHHQCRLEVIGELFAQLAVSDVD